MRYSWSGKRRVVIFRVGSKCRPQFVDLFFFFLLFDVNVFFYTSRVCGRGFVLFALRTSFVAGVKKLI